MKRVALCALVAAISSVPAMADTYRAEVGVEYANTDINGFDFDAYGLNAEVFFTPVDTTKGPLAEASFLDQASGISASWTDIEDIDDDLLSLGSRVVTTGGFIIEASYADNGEDDALSLGAGLYLNDTTDLVFTYATNDDADLDTLSADLHSVVTLDGDMSLAYSLGASYIDADVDNGFGLGGNITFYLNNQLGFSGIVDYTEVGDGDVTITGVGVDYFVAPQFRVSATFLNTDVGPFESDTLGVAASLRF